MRSSRRTHSSIDKLPAAIQKSLQEMLIDNEWPDDFPKKTGRKGKPRYKDLKIYCDHKGYSISLTAIGRFGKRMRVLAKMKQAGEIVRSVMDGLNDEVASQTQKAVAELLTAKAIELAARDKALTAKQIRDIATATRDCAQVSIKADQYRQEQMSKKISAAADSTKAKLSKAGVNRKLIQEIMDEYLGITKS